MFKFALAAAVALGMSSAAFAETTITATLNTAVSKPVELLANDTLWTCVDKACVVKTKGSDTDSWLECRKFVKQAGRVTAYGSLDDSKIAMCNAGAAK
ncbi:MAG: CC_3452 family protein [Caulobacteraceae bacterium]